MCGVVIATRLMTSACEAMVYLPLSILLFNRVCGAISLIARFQNWRSHDSSSDMTDWPISDMRSVGVTFSD